MIESRNSCYEKHLFEALKYALRLGITDYSDQYQDQKIDKAVINDLSHFINEDRTAKQWLLARCFETCVASLGLDEYLKTLICFKNSNPGKNAPINVMLASSQIARAFDPITVSVLRKLGDQALGISRQQFEALLSILTPRMDFSIKPENRDVLFDRDEMERVRSSLLKEIVDELHQKNLKFQPLNQPPELKSIAKISSISIDKLIEASKKYRKLSVTLENGILKWKFGKEPSLFVKGSLCLYDELEIEQKGFTLDDVKKQFYIFRKIVTNQGSNQRQSNPVEES